MVIIHVTDAHLSSSTPEHPSPRKWRRGSYEGCIFEKLEFVRELSEQLYAEDEHTFIWETGDLVDRPVESFRTTLRLADWMRSLVVPYIHTIGQHEIRGYALDSVDECSIGVLRRLGKYAPIGMNHQYERFEMGGGVVGQCLHVGVDHLLQQENPIEISGSSIIGNHLNIHPNSFGATHPRDIHWGGCTLCLNAHIHTGFPACEYNGTWFSAPGALARLNADEINRKPQVSVIRMVGPEVKSIEYVEVPHRPASEVFDLEAMVSTQEAEQERSEFREAISHVGAEQIGDWRSALEAVRPEVGDDVVEKLVKFCEKAGG